MEYNGENWIYKGLILYQTPGEVEVLREELRKISGVAGDIIEVGVFQGATATIIREEVPNKPLYLCDTFTGLPGNFDPSDASWYSPGHCASPDDFVKKAMEGQKGVNIFAGVFPDSAKSALKDKKFSFAHIDVDIYNSTRDSLEFIYPRMEIGGTIIVHDYFAHKGVVKAVDEFLLGKRQDNEIRQSENRQLIIYRKS